MGRSSTEGHPDLFGQFAGMRRLFAGDYEGALKYFKMGARYADKLSQISIGNMYLNGRDVDKDPVTACAWISLAAERNYPIYLQARDQACKSLSTSEYDRAKAVLHTLEPEYGDAAAKPRMAAALRSARLAFTGSRVGFDFGVQHDALNHLELQKRDSDCGTTPLTLGTVEVPVGMCGTYDPALFDAKKYFAARDAQWFGNVTVGATQTADAPASRKTEKKSDETR
jgi:TPR repeat protein